MQHTTRHIVRLSFVSVCVFILIPFGFARADGESVSTDPTLTNGLVSYWPLDEGSGMRVDVKGENDLIDYNTVGNGPGKLDNAAAFDANSEERLTAMVDGGIGGGPLSWSVWVRLSEELPEGNSENNTECFVSVFYVGTHIGNDLCYDNSTGTRQIMPQRALPGNTSYQLYHKINLADSTWHHLVMTYNGAAISGYFDGSLIGEVLTSGIGVLGGFDNITVGSRYWDGNRYVTGLIDEVGLWNRALTADEVARLYNGGVGLPYTLTEPPVPTSATSSVAFLPGIMASRLYKPRLFGLGEDKLWESLNRPDILSIAMNNDGTSVRDDIYTRDAIDYALKITGGWSLGGEGYAGFFNFLNKLKETQVIHDWKTLPYDWRLTLEALRTQGAEDEDGNISYLTATDTPYLYQELNRLADESPSGKVTIVAHSNGGLVAKYLLKKLEEAGDPLYAKIDKLILVGSPQLGTPKAIGELLHGTIPVVQNEVREVSENMPGAYQLIPSRAYFDHAQHPLVTFDASVARDPVYGSLASTTVDSYEKMRTFFRGSDGLWSEPDVGDSGTPNVLDGALLDAADASHTLLDPWVPTAGSVRVVQIAASGIDTPDRVVYYDICKKHSCWGNPLPTLQHEYGFSRRGDGTVMGGTANASAARPSYFIDLNEYNRDEEENRKHMDMLSATPVQELIRDELSGGVDILPEYVTDEEHATPALIRYRFRVYSPVDLHLYDAAGRHTGVTEVVGGDLGRTYEEEIPNSYYSEWGEVKYVGVDGDLGPVSLRLDGTGEGTFRLEIEVVTGDDVQDIYVFDAVPVTSAASGTLMLTKGGVPTLAYDLDGNGIVDARMAPGSTVPTGLQLMALKQAVQSAHMPVWLKKWINARVLLVEKELQKGKKGNLVAAKAILKTIGMTVEHQTPTNINEEESVLISALVEAVMAGMK